MAVRVETSGDVYTVILSRKDARNAVDREHADMLSEAFRRFEADDSAKVAVLYGEGGTFCAGADLKGIAAGKGNRIAESGDGPMGPTRMLLSKPVIAAVEGHAVAGGLELAVWCDLRVADSTAVFGVFCRRFGVPLIDGGTVRLPRLIGHSRALDLILTGRAVDAHEAYDIGLANRVVTEGGARAASEELARQIAAFPPAAMRADRLSSYKQWGAPQTGAIAAELDGGRAALAEAVAGAAEFAAGKGRSGSPVGDD